MADRKGGNQIFISYRRNDSAAVTGRIYDRLIQKFGPNAVFKDVDSIQLGLDFRRQLDSIISECAAVLVVIGDRWAERLDDPRDFVRIEVELALRRDIPVIPLYIQGASLPSEESLPETLRELAYRHGQPIGQDPHFHEDITRLIRSLGQIRAGRAATWRAYAVAFLLGVLALPLAVMGGGAVYRLHDIFLRKNLNAWLLWELAGKSDEFSFVSSEFDRLGPTIYEPTLLVVAEMVAACVILLGGFFVGRVRPNAGWKMALCLSAVPLLFNIGFVSGTLYHFLVYVSTGSNAIYFYSVLVVTAFFMIPVLPLLAYLGLHFGARRSSRRQATPA